MSLYARKEKLKTFTEEDNNTKPMNKPSKKAKNPARKPSEEFLVREEIK